jgi:hypothetical protein
MQATQQHADIRRLLIAWLSTCVALASCDASANPFTRGNLVISVYGKVDGGRPYMDNQASPITLQELTTRGSAIGQLTLPQSGFIRDSIANHPISGEYGSSSEGILQLTGDGRYLVIAGYGVSASAFNAAAGRFGGDRKHCSDGSRRCHPLAQTSSTNADASEASPGASRIVVPRVIALIASDGSVDTSTALTGVFDRNNPRSVASVDGLSLYVAGQGKSVGGKRTGGLFIAARGADRATAIDTDVDARVVSIQYGRLFASADARKETSSRESLANYGASGNLPRGPTEAVALAGIDSPYTPSSLSALNTLAAGTGGRAVYLSPESYFFADPTTLYVADSGRPKRVKGNAGEDAIVADGGLQKWKFDGARWALLYTLSAGLLEFRHASSACGPARDDCGTTGLIGLTGKVTGDHVELYATNATQNDEGRTYLYRIDDIASAHEAGGQRFVLLRAAEPGTIIRGVAFAPGAAIVNPSRDPNGDTKNPAAR